jgi:hypothetical protein
LSAALAVSGSLQALAFESAESGRTFGQVSADLSPTRCQECRVDVVGAGFGFVDPTTFSIRE